MLEQYADVMSVEKACEVLRIGYNAIYDLLNRGKLKAFKNGNCWHIPKIAVEEYIRDSARLK